MHRFLFWMLGVLRNTVRAAIASDGSPDPERKPAGSAVDAFEGRHPRAAVVGADDAAEEIAERVWRTRGITVSKKRVAELRLAYLPVAPASRTSDLAWWR